VGQNIFYQCTRDVGKIVESVATGKQREENGPAATAARTHISTLIGEGVYK